MEVSEMTQFLHFPSCQSLFKIQPSGDGSVIRLKVSAGPIVVRVMPHEDDMEVGTEQCPWGRGSCGHLTSPWSSKPCSMYERMETQKDTVFVQWLSIGQLFVTPGTEARQASWSFTISQSLFRLTSIESVMSSNHLILCHPLIPLLSIFPSIRLFSSE